VKQTVIIGTRGSKLALWQAEWAREQLTLHNPRHEIVLKVIKTSGDVQKHASLSAIGGQGVFTKELEGALLRNEIDIAVHSLKDLPTFMPNELCLGAITEREDPRDALVSQVNQKLDGNSLLDLKTGAIVGTSSPRRAAQLRGLRPDFQIKELRGNVDTRLAKLDAGDYDFIVLACAGLRRLGWAERIGFAIAPPEMLPAVGQGALGVQIRLADTITAEMVSQLDHETTRGACLAERSFLRAAGGGCQLPLTAHAIVSGSEIRIDGLLIEEVSDVALRRSVIGPAAEAETLGEQLAQTMLAELPHVAASSSNRSS
jgi:hydroxymethylbilane synthase